MGFGSRPASQRLPMRGKNQAVTSGEKQLLCSGLIETFALIYEAHKKRLDASLLPLRQSDMCLVCIAFASWVLKTANPQVGDTWKAVLLANVSALSAIRYLRKYVKMEAAASEKKLNYTDPSDSSETSVL